MSRELLDGRDLLANNVAQSVLGRGDDFDSFLADEELYVGLAHRNGAAGA